MVTTNKIYVCRKQADFENVRTFVDAEIAVQYRNNVKLLKFKRSPVQVDL